jgi:hypothetical protein
MRQILPLTLGRYWPVIRTLSSVSCFCLPWKLQPKELLQQLSFSDLKILSGPSIDPFSFASEVLLAQA